MFLLCVDFILLVVVSWYELVFCLFMLEMVNDELLLLIFEYFFLLFEVFIFLLFLV